MSYWEDKGKHQDKLDKLHLELVPDSGTCETLEGEKLRAISKIYYDYYNNGFGNDWLAPLKFLNKNDAVTANFYKKMKPFSESEYIDFHEVESQSKSIETLLENAVNKILESIESRTPNSQDMWDG